MFIYFESRKENFPHSYTPVFTDEEALQCRKSGVLNLPYLCLRSGRDLVYQLHQAHHPGNRATIPARAFMYRHQVTMGLQYPPGTHGPSSERQGSSHRSGYHRL